MLALLDPATAGERWALAGLSVLMAAWHLAFRRLGIDGQRPWLVLVYLVGLLALWFMLAGIDPVYFALLLVLYPQITSREVEVLELVARGSSNADIAA
ncbi:MAG TPA: hypothetical protein VFW32_08155, partial [Actinomycetes bacterium]|nr:hypothetical protein [Actinomycetes bacterium]